MNAGQVGRIRVEDIARAAAYALQALSGFVEDREARSYLDALIRNFEMLEYTHDPNGSRDRSIVGAVKYPVKPLAGKLADAMKMLVYGYRYPEFFLKPELGRCARCGKRTKNLDFRAICKRCEKAEEEPPEPSPGARLVKAVETARLALQALEEGFADVPAEYRKKETAALRRDARRQLRAFLRETTGKIAA